jgi:N-acetylglutamate synthase-like GNAT family acetyltransferase
MPDVVIDSYAAGDRDAVVALVLDIQQNELGVGITLADQPDLAAPETHYMRGAGGFWVAREGGAVVGTIGLLDAGLGVGALRKMFVRRDRRGKELGVARRLLERLLVHAREHHVDHILLGTRPEMHAAHHFYERAGFRRIAEGDLPPTFPRMRVDSVFYELVATRRLA